MISYRAMTIALAALTTTAGAQIVYNNTQINVNSTNQYSGASLIGYHVGAGQSYIVAGAPGSGSSFSFNLSATSNQLLDNDIAAGYQLPCFINNVAGISSNSGPLECGVGGEVGAFTISSTTPPSNPAPGKISFSGISAWYICAVQSFTYGWVQGTIVGSFGNGAPSGDGVQNCTSIDSIAFAVGVSSTTSLVAASTTTTGSSSATTSSPTTNSVTASVSGTASTNAASSTPTPTTLQTVGPTSVPASQDSQIRPVTMITIVVPCSSAIPVPEMSSEASTSASPSSSTSIPDMSSDDSTFTSTSSSMSSPDMSSDGSTFTSTSSPTPTPDMSSDASTSISPSSSMTLITINPLVSYTGSSFTPVASYTGVAASTEVSALIGLVFAVAALLL